MSFVCIPFSCTQICKQKLIRKQASSAVQYQCNRNQIAACKFRLTALSDSFFSNIGKCKITKVNYINNSPVTQRNFLSNFSRNAGKCSVVSCRGWMYCYTTTRSQQLAIFLAEQPFGISLFSYPELLGTKNKKCAHVLL